MANPYSKHLSKPKVLPWHLKILNWIAIGIFAVTVGVFWLAWQFISRGRFGGKRRSLQYLDDL